MAGYDINKRSCNRDICRIGDWVLENVKGSSKYASEYDMEDFHISFVKNGHLMSIYIYEKRTLKEHSHVLPECDPEDVYIVAENIIYMLHFYGIKQALEGVAVG